MYLISVEDHFESAHFLNKYRGKCEKLHGHRYRVVARLKVTNLDETGMAYDFTKLKRILAGIVKKYDHKCLNEVAPFSRINPTAENIAFTVYQQLRRAIGSTAELDSIEVWESPESCALYRPG